MTYERVTYANGWTLGVHVQQRLDEMGLTAARLFEAVLSPTLTYPGHPDKWGRPREVRVADDLAVVVTASQRLAVTVLWHGATGRDALGQAA
ncbi:MAG: hypothetical protein KGZ72_06520 [Roseovarius sp.]|jgi:hypothetical protein|nr:hypothetical protein [Roseovarius sp.]